MPLNLASPGIVVREVDLTAGRIDPTSDSVGAIAGPFAKGPIDVPTTVLNENDLRQIFGDPSSTDKHYEYWLTASSYLAYGGSLQVVRSDGSSLKNARVGSTDIKIKSTEDYNNKGYDENTISNVTFAARNPGSWANGLKIAVIDAKADQILTLNSTTGLTVGLGVSQIVPAGTVIAGVGTTSILTGYFKGIITDLDSTNNKVSVKLLSHVSTAGTTTNVDYQPKGVYKFSADNTTIQFVGTGVGATSFVGERGSLGSTAASRSAGTAITSYYLNSTLTLDNPGGTPLSAVATEIGISTSGISTGSGKYLLIDNELISLSSASIGSGVISGITRGQVGTSATSHTDGTATYYLTQFAGIATVTSSISSSDTTIGISTTRTGLSTAFNAGGYVAVGPEFIKIANYLDGAISEKNVSGSLDWFEQQEFTITSNTNIKRKWSSAAARPQTSSYAASRGSRFDELHVLVIDGDGKITGNEGTILEKHLNLSKGKDALFSVGSASYWRSYLYGNSSTIFGGSQPTGITTISFSSGYTPSTNIDWDQNVDGINFGAIGSQTYNLSNGLNYDGTSNPSNAGSFSTDVANISDSYELFKNTEEYDINFLLMGSSNYTKEKSQSLASKLIEVAEYRKDAIAFITPYRLAFLNDTVSGETVTVNSSSTITDSIVSYFSSLPSSSYAIFDSGYKYMYDRFSRVFRYVPLNGDIAGLCARNDANNFPWFSPAGTARGSILNAVKLAYNPNLDQRDTLYSNRVNPVIFSPGGGIILFGDKTGLSRASAFDRINVRRLFIYLENAISAAARDQLFEFNDDITRSNFVNIVEPFLRDVQAKRGIFDFRVICDETNNTAAVIDNSEFIADIYIKPSRSINYIGLTFVATRTGVDFEEVIGNV
jgi:hypothetical protein